LPPLGRGSFVAPGAWRDRSTSGICPGYLIALPQVREAAGLAGWWEKGQLRDRIDAALSDTLCIAIDVLVAERSAVEVYALEHANDRDGG